MYPYPHSIEIRKLKLQWIVYHYISVKHSSLKRRHTFIMSRYVLKDVSGNVVQVALIVKQ